MEWQSRGSVDSLDTMDKGTELLLQVFSTYSDILADTCSERVRSRLGALAVYAHSQGCLGPVVVSRLGSLISSLSHQLMDTSNYACFYRFVFFISRQPGQKNLNVDVAVQVWRQVLKGRFRLLDRWCAFVESHHKHAVTEDTWRQVLDFSRSVHEDLSNFDPNGAWPVLVDDFVDRMMGRKRGGGGEGGAGGAGGAGMMMMMGQGGGGDHRMDTGHDPLMMMRGGGGGLGIRLGVLGVSPVSGSKRRSGRGGEDPLDAARVEGLSSQLAQMPSPYASEAGGVGGGGDCEMGEGGAPKKRIRWTLDEAFAAM